MVCNYRNIDNINCKYIKYNTKQEKKKGVIANFVKIIEYYYDDYPYPSCLILGYETNNKILHIVCGMSDDLIHMITAYYPDTNKWEDDMKTRRAEVTIVNYKEKVA